MEQWPDGKIILEIKQNGWSVTYRGNDGCKLESVFEEKNHFSGIPEEVIQFMEEQILY